MTLLFEWLTNIISSADGSSIHGRTSLYTIACKMFSLLLLPLHNTYNYTLIIRGTPQHSADRFTQQRGFYLSSITYTCVFVISAPVQTSQPPPTNCNRKNYAGVELIDKYIHIFVKISTINFWRKNHVFTMKVKGCR